MIYSSFIDVSSLNSPELNFYYHMFGQNMGTLEIEFLMVIHLQIYLH